MQYTPRVVCPLKRYGVLVQRVRDEQTKQKEFFQNWTYIFYIFGTWYGFVFIDRIENNSTCGRGKREGGARLVNYLQTNGIGLIMNSTSTSNVYPFCFENYSTVRKIEAFGLFEQSFWSKNRLLLIGLYITELQSYNSSIQEIEYLWGPRQCFYYTIVKQHC